MSWEWSDRTRVDRCQAGAVNKGWGEGGGGNSVSVLDHSDQSRLADPATSRIVSGCEQGQVNWHLASSGPEPGEDTELMTPRLLPGVT